LLRVERFGQLSVVAEVHDSFADVALRLAQRLPAI
jgi:hypothetical protein